MYCTSCRALQYRDQNTMQNTTNHCSPTCRGHRYHKSTQSLCIFITRLPICAMLTQFIQVVALVPILALLPSVAAHGYVSKVVIDGTTYTGPLPADAAGAANNSPSPIRQIADIGPVKGATNPDINCGLSAQLASLVVSANPGSSMEFYWGNPSGGKVSCMSHFAHASSAHCL